MNSMGFIIPILHWFRDCATIERIYHVCAAIAAIWAVKTYWRNSVIERARWLVEPLFKIL